MPSTFNDVKARQMLSAFAVDRALVLAHIEIDEQHYTRDSPSAKTPRASVTPRGIFAKLRSFAFAYNILRFNHPPG